MSKKPDADALAFDIAFHENLLTRDPNYLPALETLALCYTQADRHADALKLDKKITRLDPSNPTAHYNLACSHALLGNSTSALKSLRRSIDLGYDDPDHLRTDPDLKSLHNTPEFRHLLQSLPQPENT